MLLSPLLPPPPLLSPPLLLGVAAAAARGGDVGAHALCAGGQGIWIICHICHTRGFRCRGVVSWWLLPQGRMQMCVQMRCAGSARPLLHCRLLEAATLVLQHLTI